MQLFPIPCPHCRSALYDDGRLAGQYVQCPTCHRQFQMPGGQAIPPTQIVTDANPFAVAPTKSSFVVRKQPPSVMPWVVGILGIAVLAGVGIWFLLKDQSKAGKTPVQTAKGATPSKDPSTDQATARSVVERVLNRWLLNTKTDVFKKANPDIGIVIDSNHIQAAYNIPQSYDILAGQQTAPGEFEFAVTVTYQSNSGPGVKTACKYKVEYSNKRKVWDVTYTQSGGD